MRAMSKTERRGSPIVSLTVLDGDSLENGVVRPDSRVLVVARSAETNPTHPNVVSVPTERIPQEVHDSIVTSARCVGDDPTSAVSYFDRAYVDGALHNGHNPIVNATESLLSRKLALAESLEHGLFHYRAALSARVLGTALYDNLGESSVYEPVSMVNVVVELSLERTMLPVRTSSYSVVAWAAVGSFLEGVATSDPTRIAPEFDPLTLCVHGVCLQAAQATLAHVVERPLFADSDPAEVDLLHLMPHVPGASGAGKPRTL